MQIKIWNGKLADAFFSDQELNFRGYALYLLTLIFFAVTFIVMIYDALLGYRFDAFLEMIMCIGALIIFILNIKYGYSVWIAQAFFWFIAFAAFAIVLYHHFDSTTIFLILTPIIAILILPARHVIIDFIIYETIVALLFYYGYQKYGQDNSIVFSQFALLNYITGTLYLFTFWYFYHVSIERAVSILSRLYTQKNLLLQELHHRVKNNFNLILSLLRMQPSTTSTQEFIQNFSQRIESIALVHELLYVRSDSDTIDLGTYISRLVSHLLTNSNIDVKLDISHIKMPMERLIYLGLLLNEMITNTIKHSHGNPTTITITLKKSTDGCYVLTYYDTLHAGPEMKKGFGMKIIELAARQIDALLDIKIKDSIHYSLRFQCKEHS